jgi:eukaryotic-like serine/threonine-protein kinase
VPWPVAVAAAAIAIAATLWLRPTATSSTPTPTRLDVALPFGEVLGVSPLFGDHSRGIFRVPAAGGTPELLLPLGESGPVRFPIALPGNRGLLLTVGGVPVGNRIAVLPTGQTTPRFLTNGTDARYLATGHIVFWRDGSLFASAFDLDRLELAGDAVPVIQQVAVRGNGAAMYDVSADGTLAYVKAEAPPLRTLVWVNRRGDEEPLKATAGPYAALQLSPDGQKVLLSYRTDASEDIWLHDITRQVTEPFVNEPASEWQSLWTADGERVLFTSRRAGPFHLFAKRANGLGAVEKIADDVSIILGRAPDGSALITGGDKLWLLKLADGSRRNLFGDEVVTDARVSPDGRWIAYRTPLPQGAQMWVRPYPDVQSNRWRIATARGPGPRWSPDGRTIFYRHGDDMMAVDLGSGVVPAPASPVRLFGGPYYQDFEVARDGRLLMLKEPASPPTPESRIIVVLNWFGELHARLGRR